MQQSLSTGPSNVRAEIMMLVCIVDTRVCGADR